MKKETANTVAKKILEDIIPWYGLSVTAWVGKWTSVYLWVKSVLNTGLGNQLEMIVCLQTTEFSVDREDESDPEGDLDKNNP